MEKLLELGEEKNLDEVPVYKSEVEKVEEDDEEIAAEDPAGVGVLLETEGWRFMSQEASIGIYSDKPCTIKARVTEIEEADLLPEDLKHKFLFFDKLFKDVDASEVSQKERNRLEVANQIEFTYGEVLFAYFVPLLELAKPKEGDVFWDLGCGAGRPLAIASLCFPQFSKCVGVELLDGLFDIADTMKTMFNKSAHDLFPNEKMAPIEVVKDDLLKVDWSGADVVYTSSICFPDELIEGIADQAVKLKKGARLITLKSLPSGRNYLELMHSLQLKMTWGRC